MGSSMCGTYIYKGKERKVGYSIGAKCDHHGCSKRIDRGLAYACGGDHGDFKGCTGYFCEEHRMNYITDHTDVRKSILVCDECYDWHIKQTVVQNALHLCMEILAEPKACTCGKGRVSNGLLHEDYCLWFLASELKSEIGA
jgi:hypothetical protein